MTVHRTKSLNVIVLIPAGNEEAKEIVRMLYERVSQDNNPDDIGQIRDILGNLTSHDQQ